MKRKYRLDKSSTFKTASFKFCELNLLGFLCFLFFTSCNENVKQQQPETINIKHETYYCPMHPEIQQDHPGTCPKPECKGMPLIKKLSENILNIVLEPVNSAILSSIKTINPVEKEMSISFEAQGFVDYDNRTKHDIASKYNGRIEKLYVKYNYQNVSKGDLIFDIYSPDLNTAQENLVYLLNTDSKETELINAAKQKLKLLGFTDVQIEDLVHSKKVVSVIPVISKWDGHIHEMLDNEGNNDSQGVMNKKNQATPELSVKEGMYVTRGQTVFNVVDPHQVVVMLQIRSENISKIKLNQIVELTLDETPTMSIKGKINFIEPFLKNNSKTLMARVDIDNSDHMHKVGTLVKAMIKNEAVDGVWIPAKSVIDLGKEKMVWLKKNGHFIAHKIEVGTITKDWIEVIDGITKNDGIAAEAHYLSDSESFVKISDDEK
jgi:Cu(I)/Ag(I) efflux system membrane fusion protein